MGRSQESLGFGQGSRVGARRRTRDAQGALHLMHLRDHQRQCAGLEGMGVGELIKRGAEHTKEGRATQGQGQRGGSEARGNRKDARSVHDQERRDRK